MQLKTLIDAYLASYQGRDPSLFTRLAYWRERLGDQPIADIDADAVDTQLEHLAQRTERAGAQLTSCALGSVAESLTAECNHWVHRRLRAHRVVLRASIAQQSLEATTVRLDQRRDTSSCKRTTPSADLGIEHP